MSRGRNSKQSQRSSGRRAPQDRGASLHKGKPSEVRVNDGRQTEGRHAVRELLIAGTRRVHEVFISDSVTVSPIIEDIYDLARSERVPVREVSRSKLDSMAHVEANQGVVALADPITYVDLHGLASDPEAFILVLDGLSDPQNLGSILRIAECSGVTGVVLGKHRSVRVTPTVLKAAAGAAEHVGIAKVGGIPSALGVLSEFGTTTIGLDAGGPESLFGMGTEVKKPVALVLGTEGAGLSQLVSKRVDLLVSIPLQGQLNSLNVAAAAAIACFEVVRRAGL